MYNPEYQYTEEEYWKLAEIYPDHRYEYIDGAIRMMTGGSPAHGQIAMNIGRILGNALRESHCNVYSSDVALQLTHSRIYYADISVSCDPTDWTNRKSLESPTVVVEVLSPSTERIDTGEKLRAYKRCPTIQEILFVDSRLCNVEHHHRLSWHKWEVTSYESREDVVDLSSIGVLLPVNEIYLKVYLELEERDFDNVEKESPEQTKNSETT
jgi:Uma2 family endonuclease